MDTTNYSDFPLDIVRELLLLPATDYAEIIKHLSIAMLQRDVKVIRYIRSDAFWEEKVKSLPEVQDFLEDNGSKYILIKDEIMNHLIGRRENELMKHLSHKRYKRLTSEDKNIIVDHFVNGKPYRLFLSEWIISDYYNYLVAFLKLYGDNLSSDIILTSIIDSIDESNSRAFSLLMEYVSEEEKEHGIMYKISEHLIDSDSYEMTSTFLDNVTINNDNDYYEYDLKYSIIYILLNTNRIQNIQSYCYYYVVNNNLHTVANLSYPAGTVTSFDSPAREVIYLAFKHYGPDDLFLGINAARDLLVKTPEDILYILTLDGSIPEELQMFLLLKSVDFDILENIIVFISPEILVKSLIENQKMTNYYNLILTRLEE